jgi:hypothetical protein
MKKRLLLKLGLVGLLGAGLFVAWLWWTEPRTGICRYTANRIKVGMREEEVNEIVGLGPPNSWVKHLGLPGEVTWKSTWINESGEIVVRWDDNYPAEVIEAEYRSLSESFPTKIRQWLHLD